MNWIILSSIGASSLQPLLNLNQTEERGYKISSIEKDHFFSLNHSNLAV